MALQFKGVDVPSFVTINRVNMSLLPSISQNVVSVPGRPGSYDFGNELGERRIEVDYTIQASSPSDLRVKSREWADWLYSEEADQLVLTEEPDKYYWGKLTGDSDYGELIDVAQGTVTFVCSDPHLYGQEKVQTVVMNGKSVNTIVHDATFQDSDADGVADGWTKSIPAGVTAVFSMDQLAQKIQVTSATVSSTQYVTATKSDVPVTAGKTYDFVVDHRSENFTGTFKYNIMIDWRDASNGVLPSSTSPDITKPSFNWSTLTLTATAPAGAVKANLKVQAVITATGNTGTIWFDNAHLVEEVASVQDATFSIQNNGGTNTYPVFECEFTADTTDFLIQGANNKFISLGEPLPPSSLGMAPKKTRTLLLNEDGSTFVGWTGGTNIDGGAPTGTFTSDGSKIKVSDWGTRASTGWNGPAATKGLGKSVQDFTLNAFIHMDSTAVSQMGRIEIYFLSGGARVGKFGFVDIVGTREDPTLEARAGQQATGDFYALLNPKVGEWSNFYGRIQIQRFGTKWIASIGRYNSKTKEFDQGRASASRIYNNKYNEWIDAIQIHIGVPGSTVTPIATMAFESIEFWEENVVNPTTEVPVLFEAGDKLKIDCERGLVLKNGDPLFDAMNPNSQFLELVKGSNSIQISPATVTNARVRFHERWR